MILLTDHIDFAGIFDWIEIVPVKMVAMAIELDMLDSIIYVGF